MDGAPTSFRTTFGIIFERNLTDNPWNKGWPRTGEPGVDYLSPYEPPAGWITVSLEVIITLSGCETGLYTFPFELKKIFSFLSPECFSFLGSTLQSGVGIPSYSLLFPKSEVFVFVSARVPQSGLDKQASHPFCC